MSTNVKRVEGHVAPGFESIRTLFETEMQTKAEKEAQLCIYHKGKKVVDLWACSVDRKDFNADSLVSVFSSGKSLEALGVAYLRDQGLIDYDAKISQYWPEFSANGKAEITVADLMRHEAGLVEFNYTFKYEELFKENIKKNSVGKVIENATLRLPAKHRLHRQYHAATRGWIVNELFRRLDPHGRTLGEYVRQELSKPLNIDVNIGLADRDLARTVKIRAINFGYHFLESLKPRAKGRKVEHSALGLVAILLSFAKLSFRDLSKKRTPNPHNAFGSSFGKNIAGKQKRSFGLPNVFGLNAAIKGLYPYKYGEKAMRVFNLPEVAKGESPSMNSICTARGLAKLAAVMASGGTFEGRQYFSPETWSQLHDKKKHLRIDGAASSNFTQGGLNFFTMENSGNNRIDRGMNQGREGFYGWMGAGGSIFQWNPELEIGFAFVPTSLHLIDLFNERSKVYQSAVARCIATLEKTA